MDQAVKTLLENRELGASALLAEFSNLLPGLDEAELFESVTALKQAFPLMAVWHFAEQYFQQHPLEPGSIQTFKKLIKAEKEQVLQRALTRLSSCQTILTVSRSSLVEQYILRNSRLTPTTVICSESLPGREGLALTEKLQHLDIHTTCVKDWEILDKIGSVDAILIGADWVFEQQIINKWGTLEIVMRAQHLDKPVYVLAESFKYIHGLEPSLAAFYQDWSRDYTKRRIQVFEIIPRSSTITLI